MFDHEKLANSDRIPFHAKHFEGMESRFTAPFLGAMGTGLVAGLLVFLQMRLDILGIRDGLRAVVSTVPRLQARLEVLDGQDRFSGDYLVGGLVGHSVTAVLLWRWMGAIYKEFRRRHVGEFPLQREAILGVAMYFLAAVALVFFLFLFDIDFTGIGNVSRAGLFYFPVFLPFVACSGMFTAIFLVSADIFLFRLKLQGWRFPPRRRRR